MLAAPAQPVAAQDAPDEAPALSIRPFGVRKEESDFSEQPAAPPARSVDLDTRHVGFVVNGGVEFRAHRWIGVGADVQYTHVPGILGTGGVSQQAGENDLGGIAARLKLIVGR